MTGHGLSGNEGHAAIGRQEDRQQNQLNPAIKIRLWIGPKGGKVFSGPLILSHAYQQRTHLLEESRSFYLQHQKRQVIAPAKRSLVKVWKFSQIVKEWFSKLPPDARILKENISQKHKYKVSCVILVCEFVWYYWELNYF